MLMCTTSAEMLLHALTAHPSLQRLLLDVNAVRAEDRARAGAALCALVAANAPTLKRLTLFACNLHASQLGDEGLGPLAVNTHLCELDCSRNAMSDAFALERLQPAPLANNSLRKLTLVGYVHARAASPALRQLEQLVAERAAAREAAAAAVHARQSS